ncbi:MAG: response regulator [Vicinamibacteria bacterium]
MSLRLVLAEDDPDIQLVARLSLKRAGFEVRVVGNGQAALDAVAADPPDLVLLDWMMPEMDGPETCRRLKADPATAAIPVIFLSARSQAAEVQRGLALGAAGYITKPFDALTIGDEVRRILDEGSRR